MNLIYLQNRLGRTKTCVLSVTLLLVGAVALPAQLPDAPAIERNIAGFIDGEFTAAHIPPMRSSSDGRLALNSKAVTDKFLFYLMVPEKLNEPFVDSPIGATILSDLDPFLGGLDATLFYDETSGLGDEAVHSTICDPTEEFHVPGADNNPYACGNDDCYDVTVITNTRYMKAGEPWFQLWGTPVTLRVSNPKTASAQITDITTGTPVEGTTFPGEQLFETFTTRDGRLLVGRLSALSYEWTNPITGEVINQTLDMVYSAYDETGDACDVTRFTAIHPMSHAPHDPTVNTRYGFAMRVFRDPEGTEIPDGWDMKGSYPWVDRFGRNLFFTSVFATLESRYVASCVPGEACGDREDSPGNTRGHGVVGLWTRGKMVMFDDMLNTTDYGLGALDYSHRMIDLYEPFSGPLGTEGGDIRIGTGRDNGVPGRPDGSVYNTSFLDSHEHLFNAVDNLRPVTPRDVVWIMNNGKASDEFAFDDYTSQHSLIISNMAGLITYPDNNLGMFMDYHDGWDGVSFSQPVKFQNAAAADRWDLPKHGRAVGNLRIEPIAMGGIQGKGAWLDGASGIEYDVPVQARPVDEDDWFISLFVDPRFDDDEIERVLLAFPDGSEIRLLGRHAMLYYGAAGRQLHATRFPDSLPRAAWSHLAWTVTEGGRDVVFSLNGYRFSRWVSRDAGIVAFLPEAGALGVGDTGVSSATGYVGWVDDFKVIATDLGPEIDCNHARGSLLGLPLVDNGPWATVTAKYPQWAHDQVTERLERTGQRPYARYFCYIDYSADNAAHLENQPVEAVSVRDALNFPEGPLYYGGPRPRSLENNFCLTCHTETSPRGQSLDALTFNNTINVEDDIRRQPMQPYRLAFGNIPQDWLGVGKPAVAMTAPAEGIEVDQWELTHMSDVEHKVTSFALIDANTELAIGILEEGDVIDIAALGATRVDIRANTTRPLGSVVFDLNGIAGFSTRNLKPYSLFGFSDGDYAGGNVKLGGKTLTATPYSGIDGTGVAGTPLTVNFTVGGILKHLLSDYGGDFVGNAPPPRVSYMWNADGPIGDASGYKPLIWDGVERYDSDGINGLPDLGDAGSGSLEALGGHTGKGVGEGSAFDRFVIVAYTFERTGLVEVISSNVTGTNLAGNGGEVRVYVGDKQKGGRTWGATQSVGFNNNLGFVDAGQTVYVAVGPNGDSNGDDFQLDYTLQWSAWNVAGEPQGQVGLP